MPLPRRWIEAKGQREEEGLLYGSFLSVLVDRHSNP
jgi:hypothetical protein